MNTFALSARKNHYSKISWLWCRVFPVNFAKFLRTPFFTKHLWWLHLLLDEIQSTKKMKTRESKEEKFEIKSKRNRVNCLIIYLIIYIYYVWLLRLLWRFLWKVLKNNVKTFDWQFFAYFYQISNKYYCLIFLVDLFSWLIISSGSQKYKARTNLEVP